MKVILGLKWQLVYALYLRIINISGDMKSLIVSFLVLLQITSCAVIPHETVLLSENIGSDLQVLHSSHRNIVKLYYGKIKDNINTFIDDVYSPYVIHYVLNLQMQEYKKGNPSIYSSIEKAGTIGGKEDTDKALIDMMEFCEAANNQINMKREELLSPILKQEEEVLNVIDSSYHNAIYANSTLTAYLSSLRKVKDTQDKALSIIGLDGLSEQATAKLVDLSEFMDDILEKCEQVDIQSSDAQKQIEEIIGKFQEGIL